MQEVIIKERKISIISHSIIGVALLALLVVATFYDLQISMQLSNADSFFGALFITLGEMPAYIIMPISGVILYYNNWQSKRETVAYRVLAVVIILGGFLMWTLFGSRLTKSSHYELISIFYSVLLTCLVLWIGALIGSDKLSRYSRWAIFAIIVLTISFALTWAFKLSWGRMRYRDMIIAGDTSGFTPWYLPQGNRSGDMTSFPSGHTSSACNIFVFCMLIDYSGKYKRFRYIVYSGGLLFVIMTALSRLVINAHFLSDVIIGGLLSYISYYVVRKVFFRKNNSISLVQRMAN